VSRAGALAIFAVVLASATLVQGGGWNQNAHLALVRALAHGTPIVDRYRPPTGDLARHDGHLYSAKAPGVALVSVGPYWLLDRAGVLDWAARTSGVPRDDIDLWLIAALVCTTALAVILVLVVRLGDLVAPGYGVAAAVTAGLATLLLPFSTLVFAHVPAAALAFAAFACLWLRPRSVSWAVTAGAFAGLATTFEYPVGLAVVALGCYLAGQGDVMRRGAAYVAGAAIGAAPLFLYNWWAFGSPLHLPYEDALPIAGENANERGFFGVSWPSLDSEAHLLAGSRGLLIVTPVLACAIAALVPMARRGFRHESLLIGTLALAFFVYNAGYDVPFGGDSPGPRFLVAVLPFLAVPLAVAYARWLWLTLGLAVASAVYGIGVTLTGPLQASGWEWLGGVPGNATSREAARFLPLVVVAGVFAAIATRERPTRQS
jgi:hypothetical protein